MKVVLFLLVVCMLLTTTNGFQVNKFQQQTYTPSSYQPNDHTNTHRNTHSNMNSLFQPSTLTNTQTHAHTQATTHSSPTNMIDLRGKVAFIAGVADNSGYGWAIAKQLAAAGATILLGTWPPVMGVFEKSLQTGRYNEDMLLPDNTYMNISKIYPLDASYDAYDDVPEEVRESKRYNRYKNFTISEVANQVKSDFGQIDILVHSLANGPEVTKPLLETTRHGYLSAASASAYSLVSLLQHFSPFMSRGSSAVSLSYIASQAVIPGYGGGMSSAKAALESDTKTLAYEIGRNFGVRLNCISAGPMKTRAATAIGKGENQSKPFIEYAIDYSLANAPIQQNLYAEDVANAALFLLSPLARGVTGHTLYVDNGMNIMGHATDSVSLRKE